MNASPGEFFDQLFKGVRALDEGFRALDKDQHSKVLVLLTDGEDLEKGGVRMAENLAKKNVVVFTIGVGTPAGAEIRIINPAS